MFASASITSADRRMRLLPFLVVALLAPFAGAQGPDTTHRPAGATVKGVVFDSISRAPLAGAMVQLVVADGAARSGRTVVADSLGKFAIADVPAGRYMLGFFHPMLDSLGMEPPVRAVPVEGPDSVAVDLAIPSPLGFRAAICGPVSDSDAGAVIVGVVHDARDDSPVVRGTVVGEWLELSLTHVGVIRRLPHLVATTGANGWFAICNVPSGGTMVLVASRGADSTDRIEVQVPPEGFLRRELYLGSIRTVLPDSVKADSLVPRPRRRRVGDGRVSGIVVAASNGQPLAGARVGIVDGPQTVSNRDGEWTLVDAPAGSRMLEVLALGYYPERRRVDVISSAPPVRVALSTLRAVLDTVKVTASRLSELNLQGFRERQRTAAGHFFTPDDIARRRPLETSDLFRTVPGMHVDRNNFDASGFLMRGAYGWCSPGIYLDGSYMHDLAADDIDDFVHPHEVAGIEIYSDATAPAPYQRMDGCGSVVIWTKGGQRTKETAP